MSYSDYGGYCWKNRQRFQEGEDGTLVGIAAPKNRILERATGLKLDVLINAYAQQGLDPCSPKSDEKIDWLTQHPHHAIVGGMQGMGIVSHKTNLDVTWDGKSIIKFPEYNEETYEIKESEVNGEKEGFRYWLYKPRYLDFERTGGVVFKLLTPDKDEFLGVSGSGIGDHWWLDENNNHQETGMHYPTFKEWQDLIFKWADRCK